MSEKIGDRIVEYLDQLGKNNDKSNHCLKALIDKYGIVQGIKKNGDINGDDAFSDFFLFCITKSFKSFCAVNALIDNCFFQDALILLRTIYENYLILSYLIRVCFFSNK